MSYLVPVTIRNGKSRDNPVLELLYYRGRYQLATYDALYSDGDKYRPLHIAFHKIKKHLHQSKTILVLGTGLGSAVQIADKMKASLHFTLVEKDHLVLKWAMELLPQAFTGQVKPVSADAQIFMAENNMKYDVVVADIFNSRVVPPFVTSIEFLQQCHKAINQGGYFILNYIIQHNDEWLPVDAAIRSVFAQSYCIDDGLNRIVIAKV